MPGLVDVDNNSARAADGAAALATHSPMAWWRRVQLRQVALGAALLAGAGYFGHTVHAHQNIQHWLIWRYAYYWLVTAVFCLSCLAAGGRLIRWVMGRTLPTLERITLSFTAGVLLFALATFLLGLLHGLRPAAFFLLPAAFLTVGWDPLHADLAALRRMLPARRKPLTIPVGLAALFGYWGIGLLYFQILSPESFSFDVRWYHIPLAQRYALSAAIGRSAEGFWMAGYPQLASYLYTWLFLTPNSLLFDRIELCAHLEFALFLATLAQIPILARRLLPRVDVSWSWIVLLMFPGIYLYDSNLHAGADHIAGFWAIPIALCVLRVWQQFALKPTLLCALFLSGAVLTKYTALSIVIPVALALTARALWLTAIRRQPRAAAHWAALGITALLLTAPHWLKNWIWYGDPAFPALNQHLTVHPWNPDAANQLGILLDMNRTESWNRAGLLRALRTTLSFSFVPNDWSTLHREVPVFGSLFTLTLFCLPWVRGARRLWWLYASSMAAVFVWCFLNRFDRYLQTILPWMATASACCLFSIWREGRWLRLAVIPLVGLQLAWGGDVPFIRSHNLLGDSPMRQTADFLQSGYAQRANRLRPYEPLGTIGKSFPKGAVVLAHDIITILGIDRNWITDLHQSRISYGRLLSPQAIHRELKALGVTHLLWPSWSIERDSLAGDLAFLNYATHYSVEQQKFGPHTTGRLPEAEPPAAPADPSVAVFGCKAPYPAGTYALSQLTVPVRNPGALPTPVRSVPSVILEDTSIGLAAVEKACNATLTLPSAFVLVSTRGTTDLYVRLGQ